ncbi:hypothetical protein BBJ28_00020805 [Nothophytophthora sp. Chile5]|nr:hypothetical protein BBJ28_00020805 [Nothophytophthora sp. Chile5]
MASSTPASAAPLQHPAESAIGRNYAASEGARPASANGSDQSSLAVAPQPQKRRAESPHGVRHLTIRVKKQGDKLGFGVRHDRHRRLKVSTLQGNDSLLRVGDVLLSVNDVNLTGLEFLNVIQLLKSTRPGDLLFEIERTFDAPSQRAAVGSSVLDSNGQPININALLAELKRESADKAALEDKNTALRKRLQRMLIENDKMRVRASTEVTAAQGKAQREVAGAQKALAAARAQMRLQDRGPDVARTDSIVSELTACKAQLERLRKADMDRNAVLATRYRGECRIAAADAQRVLDTLVGMFRTKLRQVGRLNRDGNSSAEVEVACDGVRRLAFMKLFSLTHDFAYYASATFHALELVRHTVEQEQFTELFGSSLCHEERTGLFFVATAPLVS